MKVLMVRSRGSSDAARGIDKVRLGECQLDPSSTLSTQRLYHNSTSIFTILPFPFHQIPLHPYPFPRSITRILSPSNNLTGPSCIGFVT